MTPLLLAGYLACFASDATTTSIALTQPGRFRETNWAMTQNPGINTAILAAEAGGLYVVTEKIQRPWLRWSLRFGIGSVHVWAAARNARELGR